MKPTPDDCFHLAVEVVREIHAEALKQFGGLKGVRDENLLASAVLAPQSTFGGKSPYLDIIEIATAYLFYLCRNHPFLDGNKRTAMMSAKCPGAMTPRSSFFPSASAPTIVAACNACIGVMP